MGGSLGDDEEVLSGVDFTSASRSKPAVCGGIGGASLLIEMVSRVGGNIWCWFNVAVVLSVSSVVTSVLLVLALSVEVLLSSAIGMNMSNVRGGRGGPTSR